MEDVKSKAMARLSKAARQTLRSGYCAYRVEDLERVLRIGDASIARLNRILERGECLHLRHGIDRATKSVPQWVVDHREDSAKKLEKIAEHLNRLCSLDVEGKFLEYSEAHGWSGTIDEQEVIDCWNEFVRAWGAFKQLTDELAGIR